MGWYYRAPASFPALYTNALRTAAQCPEQPVLLVSGDAKLASVTAERFRWFKWCIRDKMVPGDLYKILQNYDVRASVQEDEISVMLFITARSTKISEFVRLNPELAAEIVPDCQ